MIDVPSLSLPQLVTVLVAVLVVWSSLRPRAPR